MATIVELETKDGHVLSFETKDDEGPGYEPATNKSKKIRRRFDEAFEDLHILASNLTEKLNTGDLRPDQIEIAVGVKITAEAGIVFASAGGEATLNAKVTWNLRHDNS